MSFEVFHEFKFVDYADVLAVINLEILLYFGVWLIAIRMLFRSCKFFIVFISKLLIFSGAIIAVCIRVHSLLLCAILRLS